MKRLTKQIVLLFSSACFVITGSIQAQIGEYTNKELDSLFIEAVEQKRLPAKVLHAEPLYIDLIRDLGARKGEEEWNIGLGINDNVDFDNYEALVEYEFAPIDRLGLEFELPLLFYSPQQNVPRDSIPNDKLESIKMAAQWSFLVNEKYSTSLALGYIHEFELNDFKNLESRFFTGNIYNPFFIAAKRWGQNFHTLIYTGPRIEESFEENYTKWGYEWHTNLHYMIPGTRNFIGVEVNKYFFEESSSVVLRPQMRIGIAENLLIGIVAGIPVDRSQERLSTFVRLIWEPNPRYKWLRTVPPH